MKQKGSALVEYAVPLAVFGLVAGLSIYFLSANGNILDFFLGSSKSEYNSSSKEAVANHKKNIQNTIFSLNPYVPDPVIHETGTPPDANTTCVGGLCTIDFGSFTLTGVPANFADFTKTSAASGTNDKVYSMYMELASNLDAKGDAAGAQSVRDMANIVKYMSSIQKAMETTATSCKSSADPNKCFHDVIPAGIAVPASLKTLISGVTPDQIGASELGNARNAFVSGAFSTGTYPYDTPALALVSKYDEIMSSTLPNSMKGVIKELFMITNDVNLETNGNVQSFFTAPGSPYTYTVYNPITGAASSQTYSTSSLDNLLSLDIGNQDVVKVLECSAKNYLAAENICYNKFFTPIPTPTPTPPPPTPTSPPPPTPTSPPPPTPTSPPPPTPTSPPVCPSPPPPPPPGACPPPPPPPPTGCPPPPPPPPGC